MLASWSGLRVSQQYGNFYENAADDLQFGTLDADKAVCVAISHSSTLDERQYAFLQSAVLYTTADGQRRVRTCNLALQVVTLAGNVFRFSDMDVVVSHMLREGSYAVAQLMFGIDFLRSCVQAYKSENCIHSRRVD
jgi:protein transport protein SEC24